MSEPLVELVGLKKYFPQTRGLLPSRSRAVVKAVDGITFCISRSATFGLVGESGCGKTTLANLILYLEKPTEGIVRVQGRDLSTLSARELRQMRRAMQAVSQDPFASLNSWMRVGALIAEPLVVHRTASRSNFLERVASLLEAVGLTPSHASRFPHELSGGERQRVAIARALALEPEFIVLDEPVARLDVSIRSQIMNLLVELQQRLGLTYLIIGHDLPFVTFMSMTVGVMYLGKMIEICPAEGFENAALHPYSRALLQAIPVPDPRIRFSGHTIKGSPGNPLSLPTGCRFHPRCSLADTLCINVEPELRAVAPAHKIACHHVGLPTGSRPAEPNC